MVITQAFQAWDTGSIPAARSSKYLNKDTVSISLYPVHT